MSSRSKVLPIAILIIGLVLLLPVILGEARSVEGLTGGHPLRNFVYDFQTLIAGVLAILAAWLTVHVMELTDIKAQHRHEQILQAQRENEEKTAERHRDLVKLQLRPDQLAVERLCNPGVLQLLNIWRQTPSLTTVLTSPALSAYELEGGTTIQNLCDATVAWSAAADELLRSAEFIESKHLWKGQFRSRYKMIAAQTHTMLEEAEKAKKLLDPLYRSGDINFVRTEILTWVSMDQHNAPPTVEGSPDRRYISARLALLTARLASYGCYEALGDLIEEMVEMAGEYDVTVSQWPPVNEWNEPCPHWKRKKASFGDPVSFSHF